MDTSNSASIEALAARIDELQAVCARLAADNADLRSALATPTRRRDAREQPFDPGTPDPVNGQISRRGLLGKAITAAAVTAAGSAVVLADSVLPAAAATGDAVLAGRTTLAEGSTTVDYDGTAALNGVVFLANDSEFVASDAAYPAALGGWAGDGTTGGKVPSGVYGYTENGAGYGVVGVNASTASEAVAVYGLLEDTSPGGFSSAVRGKNNGTGGLGIGVWGSQNGSGWGMYATSASGIGLTASGGTGVGVEAFGATGVAADGSTIGVSATGPIGVSASGPTAVSAEAEGATGIAVLAKSDSSAATVKVTNTGTGRAVNGVLTDVANGSPAVAGVTAGPGTGILGQATGHGKGVIGKSLDGIGVLANSTTGIALDVVGKVRFSRSGTTTVPAGHAHATVTLAGVSPSSLVLATLQNLVGDVVIAAVVPAVDEFKISLTNAPTTAAKVAWFVIN